RGHAAWIRAHGSEAGAREDSAAGPGDARRRPCHDRPRTPGARAGGLPSRRGRDPERRIGRAVSGGHAQPDGELLPFKNAPFGLAIAAQVPVVPLYVRNTFEILPKGG